MPLARSFAVAAALALVSVAPYARADGVPKYSELPSGRMTAPPARRAPSSIAKNETAPGLFTAVSPSRDLRVAFTQKTADEAARGAGIDRELAEGCFSRTASDAATSASRDLPSEWERLSGFIESVGPAASTRGGGPGVVAVHGERVVEIGGRATLESTDAWVDPSTRGVRLIAKESLPLVQVATAPGPIRVFVGRDDRADGRRFVELVVLPAKGPSQREFDSGRITVTPADGTSVSTSSCRHVRVMLPAMSGVADSTAVQLNAILPPLPLGAKSAAPLPDSPPPGSDMMDVRVRPLRLHFAVSQASQDKEPLIAVSMGWAGRERTERVSAR
jgi:hypothetical protein